MDSRKTVLHQTGGLLVGELICLAVMCGVFALIGAWDRSVLLGGLLGVILAVGNFFLMAVNADAAADRAVNQDVKGGAALMRTSYILRLAVMFVLLFAGAKSGLCNPIASIIPLILMRWILTIIEFFNKKGDA